MTENEPRKKKNVLAATYFRTLEVGKLITLVSAICKDKPELSTSDFELQFGDEDSGNIHLYYERDETDDEYERRMTKKQQQKREEERLEYDEYVRLKKIYEGQKVRKRGNE